MAKKKPSYKNVRQGQTVYTIDPHYERGYDAEPEIISHALHSQKVAMPPECCVIERLPINFLRQYLKREDSKGFFFSRKKAITALKMSQCWNEAQSHTDYHQARTLGGER